MMRPLCSLQQLNAGYVHNLLNQFYHQRHLVPNARKVQLHATTLQDEDVQFHWTLISLDIDNEDYTTELLQEIIALWLTVRGYSVAASWMEQYKIHNRKTTKKSSSLRKGLKRSRPSEEDIQ